MIEAEFETRDGRRVTYASFGRPGGFPMIHCHGSAESRLFEVDPGWTEEAGVWVVTPDRPGFGGSDPLEGRTLLSSAADLEDLADLLEIDRFAVLGWSGGGPHALACAHRLGARITAVALFASAASIPEVPGLSEALSPTFRLLAEGAQADLAGAVALVAEVAKQWVADPESFVGGAELPPADQAVYEHPVWGENLKAQLREGLRRTDGIASDAGAVYGPWGFDIAGIGCPVSIWHGSEDNVAPPLVGRRFAEVIPGARFHALAGEGHFAIYPHWQEVVAELLDISAAAGPVP